MYFIIIYDWWVVVIIMIMIILVKPQIPIYNLIWYMIQSWDQHAPLIVETIWSSPPVIPTWTLDTIYLSCTTSSRYLIWQPMTMIMMCNTSYYVLYYHTCAHIDHIDHVQPFITHKRIRINPKHIQPQSVYTYLTSKPHSHWVGWVPFPSFPIPIPTLGS